MQCNCNYPIIAASFSITLWNTTCIGTWESRSLHRPNWNCLQYSMSIVRCSRCNSLLVSALQLPTSHAFASPCIRTSGHLYWLHLDIAFFQMLQVLPRCCETSLLLGLGCQRKEKRFWLFFSFLIPQMNELKNFYLWSRFSANQKNTASLEEKKRAVTFLTALRFVFCLVFFLLFFLWLFFLALSHF